MFHFSDHDRWDGPRFRSFGGPTHARAEQGGNGLHEQARDLLSLEMARLELRRVHRRELVRLLLRAAGDVVRCRGAGSPLAPYPLAPLAPRAWHRRARRALRLAALEGLRGPEAEALRLLLHLPRRRWPDADELTGLAVSGDRGATAQLCHAQALLARGDRRSAEEWFRALLDRNPAPWARCRAYEGLAAVHDLAGRSRMALGAMEMAADEPSCGVGPLAGGLYLALCAGDRRRCRQAAARLDLLVQPDEPAFLELLARLREWAPRGAGGRDHRGTPRAVAGACGLRVGGSSAAERLLSILI